MAIDKYQLFHINIEHGFRNLDLNSWKNKLGSDNVFSCKTKDLAQIIPKIIISAATDNEEVNIEPAKDNLNEISW